MKKKLMAALALVLVIAMSVAGTYAYLTSQASVKNTFTVGNVAITMDEAKVDEYGVVLTGDKAGRGNGNTYKLVPSKTYTKDPTIHVGANSEDCYLFVEIENGLDTDGTINGLDGWKKVADGSNIYYYIGTGDNVSNDGLVVTKGSNVQVFESFTFANNADPDDYKNASIVIKACAIQADGFRTAMVAYQNAVTFGNA